jgi:hypothetical protein
MGRTINASCHRGAWTLLVHKTRRHLTRFRPADGKRLCYVAAKWRRNSHGLGGRGQNACGGKPKGHS